MGALHELVKAGKDARYLGASATYAWQFEKAQFVAAVHGWTPCFHAEQHEPVLQGGGT